MAGSHQVRALCQWGVGLWASGNWVRGPPPCWEMPSCADVTMSDSVISVLSWHRWTAERVRLIDSEAGGFLQRNQCLTGLQYGCGSSNVSTWHLGKWKQRLNPSSLILSHTYIGKLPKCGNSQNGLHFGTFNDRRWYQTTNTHGTQRTAFRYQEAWPYGTWTAGQCSWNEPPGLMLTSVIHQGLQRNPLQRNTWCPLVAWEKKLDPSRNNAPAVRSVPKRALKSRSSVIREMNITIWQTHAKQPHSKNCTFQQLPPFPFVCFQKKNCLSSSDKFPLKPTRDSEKNKTT